MNVDEFKAKVIEEGVASVHKHETRPERIKGALEGFEFCKSLNTFADFEECLELRHAVERIAQRSRGDASAYWEHRLFTCQVEFVFERMKVVWGQFGLYSGPLSAKAVIQTARIVGVTSARG